MFYKLQQLLPNLKKKVSPWLVNRVVCPYFGSNANLTIAQMSLIKYLGT